MNTQPFRFYPSDKETLKVQMEAFLSHPALNRLYNLLGVIEGDPYTQYCDFNKKYNLREIKDSQGKTIVLPEQEIQDNAYIKEAEVIREEIYTCLKELGFFSSFESRLHNPTHLILLGGPISSNIERVNYAKSIDTSSIQSIYALGCDRPITDSERKICPQDAQTEFQSLSLAIQERFGLSSYRDVTQNIRSFISNKKIIVLSAPSSKKDYRADTLDTLHFFQSVTSLTKEDQLLFITHPYLVNGHGLTIYNWATQIPASVDVIGCKIPIVDNKHYSIGRYFQHLLRILRQIFKEVL